MLSLPRWKKILLLLICVVGILYALPNFVPALRFKDNSFLPGKTINLGLDLKGGAYLLMQVQTNVALSDKLSQDQLGIAQDITQNGGQVLSNTFNVDDRSITIHVSSDTDLNAIRQALYSKYRSFTLDIDKTNHVITLTMGKRVYNVWLSSIMEQTSEIIRRRLDETGTKQPIVARQNNDNIAIQLPGVQNVNEIERLIGRTAKLTYHTVDSAQPRTSNPKLLVSSDEIVLPDASVPDLYWVLNKNVAVDGSYLDSANATYANNQVVVSFRFNRIGSRLFGQLTQNNVGKPIAIVLDNKVISAPVVNTPILNGSGYISGSFTYKTANDLAILLRAGALPAPLQVIEKQVIGPELGKDSMVDGVIASIIGLLLIVTYMVLAYGIFGLFAFISLLFNLIFMFALLTIFRSTLTLSGIAGIVLTIGMSVDANVLIFENIRQEKKLGRTIFSAIQQGYQKTFSIIMDANLTTFLAALMLYLFGIATIRGFAVTLTFGLIASVFSSVWLTRLWTALWLEWRKPKNLNI